MPVNRNDLLFFILAVCTGIIIFQPDLIYQGVLFQGDHGRDLLAFSMTAKGLTPYRDFFWDYGPLPLYYFAAFFKLFGESIRTALLAEVCLKLIAGMVVFLIMRPLKSPLWSYLASVFFMSFYPYFFHTYSHTLGVVLILVVMYFLISYVYAPKKSYLYMLLGVLFILSLTKITLAIVSFFSCAIALAVIHKNLKLGHRLSKGFYLAALVIVPGASVAVYYCYLHGLPDYILQHIFYYSIGSERFFNAPMGNIIWAFRYIVLYLADHWRNPIIVGLIAIALPVFFYSLRHMEADQKKRAGLAVFVLIFFYFTHIHEYLLTGYYHRLFWGAPFLILLLFFCLATLAEKNRALMFGAVLILGILILSRVEHKYVFLKRHLLADYYLETPRGSIFTGNPLSWMHTAKQTLHTLETQLKPGEDFLCAPYDPIYYFLMDQASPVYPVAFFDFMRISPELEQQVLAGLVKNNVNWIIISNRIVSDEESLGSFGKTNSVLLGAYILEHFEIVREFGDWSRPAGITSNHAVSILKRVR